jgi:hypothetical protein
MDRRRVRRNYLIKRAHIVFGGTSLDGVALDLSLVGARIFLPTPSEVPERVILRLPDGDVRPAHRRWQRGAEVGFEFISRRDGISLVS